MRSKNKNLSPTNKRENYSPIINIQDQINDLFDSFFSALDVRPNLDLRPNLEMLNKFPLISLAETEDHMIIKAELPFIDEKDVKIEINRNRIIISGEKKDEPEKDRGDYHTCELVYGKFFRTISLPFEIDPKKTTASFIKGVLKIEIEKPKTETKTHTIPISHKNN